MMQYLAFGKYVFSLTKKKNTNLTQKEEINLKI